MPSLMHLCRLATVPSSLSVKADGFLYHEAELALRFYRTWGYVPVYIHKVGMKEGLVESEDA